jgi:hypothetical protein
MPLKEYTEGEFFPRHLSKEHADNPQVFLAELFDFAHLPQLRILFRQLFNTTITGTWNNFNPTERMDMVTLYEKMEQLLEIAHILYTKEKKPRS